MEVPRGQAAFGTQHQLRAGPASSSVTVCTSYRQMGHSTVPGMFFQWSSCHLEAVQDLLFQDVLSRNPPSFALTRQHVLAVLGDTGAVSPRAWVWGLGWELVTAKSCGRSRAGPWCCLGLLSLERP